MKKIVALLFVMVLGVVGCSQKSNTDEPLKVAATTWVGYLPLFYAQQQGWLKEDNIQIIKMSTLTEGMMLFDADKVDVVGGTQYEYSILSQKHKRVAPLLFVDKSNGGDLIMSNRSIEQLQHSKEIYVYLETDSVNKLMLEDFIKKYGIQLSRLKISNKSQVTISNLKNEIKDVILIVTYHPFDNELKKQGFKEILSTASGMDIVVIDALFAEERIIHGKEKQTTASAWYFNVSVDRLHKDPKEFFEVVKGYIPEYTYEEFLQTTSDIKWINRTVEPELLSRLKDYNIAPHD